MEGLVATSPKSCHTKASAARKCLGTFLNSKPSPFPAKFKAFLSSAPRDYLAITCPHIWAWTIKRPVGRWRSPGKRVDLGGTGLYSRAPPFLNSGKDAGEAERDAG